MISQTSLRVMNESKRSDRIGLWVALGLGMLLMLAAALAGAEEAVTVRRTDHFNATMPAGSTLRIENISGEIVAAPGRDFSATVTVTVTARTKARAEELLRLTTITQKRDGDEFSLESDWPYSDRHSRSRWRRHGEYRCEDCRITAQFQVTVPAGVKAVLHTVNGEVRSEGADADLDLQSVNGSVSVRGARRTVSAGSVNGKIDVAMLALPSSAEVHARTVNGAVVVTLPKDARFDVSASTMNGTIGSSFALPAQAEPAEAPEPPRKPAPPRTPRRVVVRDEGEDVVVDIDALQKEIEQSMKQVEVEMRDVGREMRRIKVLPLQRAYSGSIGQGGGKLRLSTLNGSIVVLAAGTTESDAKRLVPERRGLAVTIPDVRVKPKTVVRAAPRIVINPGEEQSVVRGDVAGDFLSTSGGGTYRIGKVSGNVKIVTHSGEIHVASAGAGADLTTYGGDVRIGPVTGDLLAKTLAGEVRSGAVSGSIKVETSGGDIRVESVGGTAVVRTAGGDIVLPGLRGSLEAETGGGDVRVAILSREVRGGVTIRDAGGDVTVTVPGDFRADVELEVRDAEPEETRIRSDFPEVAVTRQRASQRASGALNGGGPKLVVRTHSGTIRLRKGSPGS